MRCPRSASLPTISISTARPWRKAYKLLERDSIIEAKGYRSTYVHPKAKANCKFNLREWTQRKLSEAIAELREAGVTDSEIRNAFAGAIGQSPPGKVRCRHE